MAEENQDGQEKTEQPSQRKLDKARADGQVLSSKEAFVFTTLAMGLIMLMAASPVAMPGLKQWAGLFVLDNPALLENIAMARLSQAWSFFLLTILIVGVPLMIVVLLTQAAVGGINFAPKALAFKASRINPIAGLQRIFSIKGLVELGKSILKVSLLFAIAGAVIWLYLPRIIPLSKSTLNGALGMMKQSFPALIGGMLVALLIIAALDYAWQFHSHMKKMKMSRQELKDEFKQTEGSPEVKAKIRRLQMAKANETARQREALDSVPEATAIITNPTHFAVALKYTPGQPGAPLILALGRGSMALQIIDRGEDHGVTIFRSPMLARALYFTGSIGAEIAEPLYNAVAVVLAYIYKLDRGELMEMPQVELPEDMQFDETGKPALET